MATRSTFPLVDKVMGGNLADELVRLRAEGVSYDGIVRWLSSEHDVQVSIETVRRWFLGLSEAAEVPA